MRALIALCLLLPFLWASPETIHAEEAEALVVTDGGGAWAGEGCDIFHNPRLLEPVLHPGAGGTYPFTLRNTADHALTYTLATLEDDPNHIPMEYRLRAGNIWLVGSEEEWVPAAELPSLSGTLATGATYALELDWRWPFSTGDEGDAYDTLLGTGAAELPEYNLTITVAAEQAIETSGGSPAQSMSSSTAGSSSSGQGGTTGRQPASAAAPSAGPVAGGQSAPSNTPSSSAPAGIAALVQPAKTADGSLKAGFVPLTAAAALTLAAIIALRKRRS